MIVCVNGVFGGRMLDVAQRAGANVTKVESRGGSLHAGRFESGLASAKPKVVGIVMAETSTGAYQPIEEISSSSTKPARCCWSMPSPLSAASRGSGRLEHRCHLLRHASA
jgi:hypothetical protein